MGLDAAGNAIAVWRQAGTDDTIWTARFDEVLGEWGSATQVPAASGTVGFGPVAAMNDAGVGALAWHESGMVWARVYDPSGGWQPVAGLGSGGMVEGARHGWIGPGAGGVAVWRGRRLVAVSAGERLDQRIESVRGGRRAAGFTGAGGERRRDAVLGWQEADGVAGTSVFARRFAVDTGVDP